jgi:hypothetical protein
MKTHTVELTDRELEVLLEAIDSHVYWQLSDESERNNGHVYATEDSENAEEIKECSELEARIEVLLGRRATQQKAG